MFIVLTSNWGSEQTLKPRSQYTNKESENQSVLPKRKRNPVRTKPQFEAQMIKQQKIFRHILSFRKEYRITISISYYSTKRWKGKPYSSEITGFQIQSEKREHDRTVYRKRETERQSSKRRREVRKWRFCEIRFLSQIPIPARGLVKRKKDSSWSDQFIYAPRLNGPGRVRYVLNS